jgi:polyhydroxybutyrate depolymerase
MVSKQPARFAILLAFLCLATSFVHTQTPGNIQFDGQQRSFITYIPADWTPAEQWPVVFVLHGFTQTAEAIMGVSGFNAVADSNHFICVYPNGINNGWNTNNPFPGSSTANDVGFIRALADTIAAQYNIDPKRVYACGFSAGGFMSHKLACEATDRIAAIASVSGTMTTAALGLCQPSRPVPVLQIHGTADGVVAYNGSFANLPVENILSYWNNHNACPSLADTVQLPDLVSEGSTVQQITRYPCADSTEVRLLKIIGGGHTWPGGTGIGGIGNTNRDINASREIWTFFSRFSLPVTSPTNNLAERHLLRVFPNPAQHRLEVSGLDPAEPIELQLYDTRGQRLLTASETTWLALGNLPAGMYYLHVQNGARRQVLAVQIVQ